MRRRAGALPPRPPPPAMTNKKGDYEIGYKKPPKHFQFKKGQSGYPQGRPRSAQPDQLDVAAVLSERLPVKINGASRRMDAFEVWLRALARRAVKDGNLRAALQFLKILVPTFDGGDDCGGICGPPEGLGIGVVLVEEAVDGGLQIDDRAEDAAFQPPLGELGEEALDGVEPRTRGRREVERPARMAGEPCTHLEVLMGGVVVDHGMDCVSRRDRGFDTIQEASHQVVGAAGIEPETCPINLAEIPISRQRHHLVSPEK